MPPQDAHPGSAPGAGHRHSARAADSAPASAGPAPPTGPPSAVPGT